MATDEQFAVSKLGGGTFRMQKVITLTMAAGVAVTDSTFTPPLGSTVGQIRWTTGTSFTGAPTNIYLTVGKTAGGQDYVANTDIKTATGPTSSAPVAIADWASWPAQALFCTLTANGGTNPAGTCTVFIDYAPPNF